MRRILPAILLVFSACYVGQSASCGLTSKPTPHPTATPTATPTPPPTPTAFPTPTVNCTPDWLLIEGPSKLAYGEVGRYWLTPMQYYLDDRVLRNRPVPDACNIPKKSLVRWSIHGQMDAIYAIIKPDGFSADVTRAHRTASIGVRADFEGLFSVLQVN